MLRRDSRGLQQALQDAGLQMDSGNLSFNLGNGGAASGEQSADGGQAASVDEAAAGVTDASGTPDDTAPRRQTSNSMIDVEV